MKELSNVPFALGRVFITPGVQRRFSHDVVALTLARHSACDWGDVSDEHWDINNNALKNGEQIISKYSDNNGNKFWIITETNRSITTVLLPSER